MNIAVILAGGVGSRLGAEQPKQFVEILGKPIIVYTIQEFEQHPSIDEIGVVCIKEYIEILRNFILRYNLKKVKWIVEGGLDFQHSVLSGINALRSRAAKEDIVLIHYAASPFVSEEIISDGIEVAKEKGNCVSATPCYLLLGSNDDGIRSTRWVDRDQVMQLNSPQCFRFEYVDQLYYEAEEQGLFEEVEPHTTSLMYRMGRTIYFSKGNQSNIKITTKEDLDLFEGYVLMRRERGDL